MKNILCTLLFFVTGLCTAQTTAEDSVKTVINSFFDGMQRKDTTHIRTLLSNKITMQSVMTTPKGVLHTEDKIEAWFNQIVTLPPSIKTIDERITFESIKIDEAMAIAWLPFRLYLNDTLYSCGVNMMQLVKLNNEWKINYLIDTRRRKCPTDAELAAAVPNKKEKRKHKKKKDGN